MSPATKFIISIVVCIIATLTILIVTFGQDPQSETPAVGQPNVPEAAAARVQTATSPSNVVLGNCMIPNHTAGEYEPCVMPATWEECMAEALNRYDSYSRGLSPFVDRARGVLDWDMMVCDRLFPAGGHAAELPRAADGTAWRDCIGDARADALGKMLLDDDRRMVDLAHDLAVCDWMFPAGAPYDPEWKECLDTALESAVDVARGPDSGGDYMSGLMRDVETCDMEFPVGSP